MVIDKEKREVVDMGKEYMTVEELCEWLQISRSTVDRLRKKGLPHILVDRILRFEKEEIQDWLESYGQKN